MVVPPDFRAGPRAQDGSRQTQRSHSPSLPRSSPHRQSAALPSPAPQPLQTPFASTLRVSSRRCASSRSSSGRAPCLERVLSDCWSAPSSSSSSSPSWSRGPRPYFSHPSLVNSNPCLSNTFASLHHSGNLSTVMHACPAHCVVAPPGSLRSLRYKLPLTGQDRLGKVRPLRLPKRALPKQQERT